MINENCYYYQSITDIHQGCTYFDELACELDCTFCPYKNTNGASLKNLKAQAYSISKGEIAIYTIDRLIQAAIKVRGELLDYRR